MPRLSGDSPPVQGLPSTSLHPLPPPPASTERAQSHAADPISTALLWETLGVHGREGTGGLVLMPWVLGPQ